MLAPSSLENLVNVLRKCTSETAAAPHLHAYVCTLGLEAHSLLSDCLISVLLEGGNVRNAQKVFDASDVRSECSWNSLLIAYVKFGEPQNALALYQTMGEEAALLNGFAFVALLKACTNIADPDTGRDLHGQIARKNLLESNVIIGTTLVDMYAKCGILIVAQEVFDKLPEQDLVSWTALIAGYAQHDYSMDALNCFDAMQQEGITPNATTFASVLKACGRIGAEEKGSQIHDELVRKKLLKTNQVVGNALVDMYAKCGSLNKAREVFDVLPIRDVVSWTALISGYAQHDHGEDALSCFEQMQRCCVPLDVVTFVSSLKACGSVVAADKGEEIHAEITRRGILESNCVLGSALVDMYTKCGMLPDAQSVFDKLLNCDVDSWNALISGYAQHKCGEEALMCFEQMQKEGFSPDATTFACVLSACGSIGATKKGGELHAAVEQKGVFKTNLIVGNALVDMYAKCGLLTKAQEAFKKLELHDIISWNTLITGYAHLGDIQSVLRLLFDMENEGIQPNPVTLISVLNAFNHEGLIFEAEMLFNSMSKEFGISPAREHCTCMVDLFGRAGQLGKAADIFKKLSSSSDLVMSLTVLGACRKWGNVELGREAFERAVRLDERDAAAYICMYDIYMNAGMLNDAKKVDAMRVRKQAWKRRESFDGLLALA